MAANLRKRNIWQDKSGLRGEIAETKFEIVFLREFLNTTFEIRTKPKEFRDIYSKNPKHGIVIDYAICNTKNNKTLYVEIKRQDGWIPGVNSPNAGRGNAHERLCKFFTPGLLKIMRKKANLKNDMLPFWVVFQGNITKDPKRKNEINFWFDEFSPHVFFWNNLSNSKSIVNHFNKYLKPLLE